MDLKTQIINLTHDISKTIFWRYWANQVKTRKGIADLYYESLQYEEAHRNITAIEYISGIYNITLLTCLCRFVR